MLVQFDHVIYIRSKRQLVGSVLIQFGHVIYYVKEAACRFYVGIFDHVIYQDIIKRQLVGSVLVQFVHVIYHDTALLFTLSSFP